MRARNNKWIWILIEISGWLLFLSIPFFLIYLDLHGRSMHPHHLPRGGMHPKHSPPIGIILVRTFLLIAGYYFSYFYLVPYFYFTKKFKQYTFYSILLFLLIAFLPSLPEVFRHGFLHVNPPGMIHFFMALFVILIPLGLRIYQRLQESEKEKTNAELSFLKSQINHHFLFNSLNNIYSLSIQGNANTSYAIHSLSFIMRYILDEATKEKTWLQQELEYMQHYISIQRLRLNEKVKLEYTVTGNPDNLFISPMLLIPFVENCFKHGLSTIELSTIDIVIRIQDAKIELTTKNKVFQKSASSHIASGIGIENVCKRLDMDYPAKYQLQVSEKENYYFVTLQISLV